MLKKTLKSIVFDLDDTICRPDHTQSDSCLKYSVAEPVDWVIQKMHALKASGYYIIIHTARRMATHNGDINKILADVGSLTEEWLNKHNVPYDELRFGKPHATTYYVDDKSMNMEQFKTWEIK